MRPLVAVEGVGLAADERAEERPGAKVPGAVAVAAVVGAHAELVREALCCGILTAEGEQIVGSGADTKGLIVRIKVMGEIVGGESLIATLIERVTH